MIRPNTPTCCVRLDKPNFRSPAFKDPGSAKKSMLSWRDFEVGPTCWWLHPALRRSVPELALQLENAFARFTAAQSDTDLRPYLADFQDELVVAYVRECCVGEGTGTSTLCGRHSSRADIKAINIRAALAHALSDLNKPLGLCLVQDLHRLLGCGLMSSGVLRVTPARPAGHAMFYLAPHLVRPKLEELLAFIAAWTPSDALDASKRAAVFMSRFLFIHPFPNGNGRLARICVSRLMAPWSCVPVSLFSAPKSREHYLACLLEAHMDGDLRRPQSLALYIMWCACQCTTYCLDV